MFHLGEIDDIGGEFLLWKHTESFYTNSQKISLSRLAVAVAVAHLIQPWRKTMTRSVPYDLDVINLYLI